MNNHNNLSQTLCDAVVVGIDWADAEHVVCVIDQNDRPRIDTLQQSPQAIDEWVAKLSRRFPGKTITIAIEQSVCERLLWLFVDTCGLFSHADEGTHRLATNDVPYRIDDCL